MKRRNLTYFITLAQATAVSPAPIQQDAWDKLVEALNDILHPHNTPLDICGQRNEGRVLLEANAVSFSPVDHEAGGDFSLKRVGSRIVTRVKSKCDEYDILVGACLLAIKKYIPQATVSHTGGVKAWDASIKYFQYAVDVPVPVVYPAQARTVCIDFEWDSSAPAEDCASVLEDIRALLAGTAKGVVIRFDKPE